MQIRYQKDFNHSYLMIQAEQEVEMETYPIRMLLGNSIDALIPCKIQTLNGTKEFCYDITGRQSVSSRLSQNKIRESTLRDLLLGFMKAITAVQAFLIDVNQLVVLPEYMYFDDEKKMLQFCYLPGYDKEIREQFRGLLEYLLPLIDHQDSEAVVMGYGIYRQTIEEGFNLDQMKECIYREHREEHDRKAAAVEANVENNMQETEAKWNQELFQEYESKSAKEQNKNAASWETILASAVWTIVLLGICVLRYLGYLPFLTFPMLLGIFIAALGVLAVNTYLRKRHKERGGEVSGKWEQKTVAQASIQWPGKKAVEPEEIRKNYDTEEPRISRNECFSENREQEMPSNASLFGDGGYKTSRNASFSGSGNRDWEMIKNRSSSDNREEEKQEVSSIDLGDTQPLPQLNLPKTGHLISKRPECLPDIALMGDLTVLGKLKGTVDVIISQPTVSRMHAKVRRVDQEYYLVDLHSRNGTYLNGRQIPSEENCRIVPGDEIRFADAEYTFSIS